MVRACAPSKPSLGSDAQLRGACPSSEIARGRMARAVVRGTYTEKYGR